MGYLVLDLRIVSVIMCMGCLTLRVVDMILGIGCLFLLPVGWILWVLIMILRSVGIWVEKGKAVERKIVKGKSLVGKTVLEGEVVSEWVECSVIHRDVVGWHIVSVIDNGLLIVTERETVSKCLLHL